MDGLGFEKSDIDLKTAQTYQLMESVDIALFLNS